MMRNSYVSLWPFEYVIDLKAIHCWIYQFEEEPSTWLFKKQIGYHKKMNESIDDYLIRHYKYFCPNLLPKNKSHCEQLFEFQRQTHSVKCSPLFSQPPNWFSIFGIEDGIWKPAVGISLIANPRIKCYIRRRKLCACVRHQFNLADDEIATN